MQVHAGNGRRRPRCATWLGAALLAGGCVTQQPEPGLLGGQNWDSKAAAKIPPNALTLYRLAGVLAAAGRDPEAEAVLITCRRRNPEFVPVYVDLSGLYVRNGRLDEAAQVLEQALQRSPRDPVLLNDLGMCWMLKGDYEQALGQFTLAAAAAPQDARFLANQALATGMSGRYDEALELYRRVLPEEQAHFNVGLVCEARKDQKRAAAEFVLARAAPRAPQNIPPPDAAPAQQPDP